MQKKVKLPTPLAAASYYLVQNQQDNVAHQLAQLWHEKQLDRLKNVIAKVINDTRSSDPWGTEIIEELSNFQVYLQATRNSILKAQDHYGHILIADSHDTHRPHLVQYLEGFGHHVHIAKSAAACRDSLIRCYYDLIIIHINLKDASGIELLTELKSSTKHADIPVIMLSNSPQTNLAAQVISEGAEDFLTPPFAGNLFIARVNAALETSNRRVQQQMTHREIKRKNHLVEQLAGKYLNHAVVDQLLSRPHGTDLGGELREITLLMCDMRGFTRIADRLAPQQVVTLLNTYLGKMTSVVHAHGGIVNEFEGDSILALFNAPLHLAEHTPKALACAVEMQQSIPGINLKNQLTGLPNIGVGIGVVKGEVVVGNMGSEERTKYGVVGSPVNLSARLQSIAEAGEIVALASQLGEGSGGAIIKGTQKATPKGFDKPVEVAILMAP